jgi:hypothetical protein
VDKIEAKFKKSTLILPMMRKNMFNILPIIQVKSTIKEHFAMLSKDVNDLIKIFERIKKYIEIIAMYDQGKSGYWISEFKEINPYYGSEMLTCGGITQTW